MAIYAGRRVKRVKRISVIKRHPIRRIAVGFKDKGKKVPHSKPTIQEMRAKGYWNVIKIKGSFVWSIIQRKLTKAERKKLKKLTPPQRRVRRRRIYRKLLAILRSPNPLGVKIGKRIAQK